MMDLCKRKRYLFISDTDFESKRLTGAHKRFLELVRGIAKTEEVTLVTNKVPQLSDVDNITFFYLEQAPKSFLPKHIAGMLAICKVLVKEKKRLVYDYAISFSLMNAVCYNICGVKNVISLFREDTIEYLKATGASRYKIGYFQYMERIAVRISKKIIVQCKNDKKNLIERNKKYCKEIDKKIFIQINNANASWMNTVAIAQCITNEKVNILFIGDFSNIRKGHSILLPAVKKLIDVGYQLQLLVAGDGVELEKYKMQYADYSDIVFLGRVSNISQYLKISNFMVVPSFIDSCPNTVLEGLNAGIAVYGANSGGIPDLLVEEKYMFEPDENSIYNFLKRVIDENTYVTDAFLQKKAKEVLTFDWANCIKEMIET